MRNEEMKQTLNKKEGNEMDANKIKIEEIDSKEYRKPEPGAIVIEKLEITFGEKTDWSHEKCFFIHGVVLVGIQIGFGNEALICKAYEFEYTEWDMAYALDINSVFNRIKTVLAELNKL